MLHITLFCVGRIKATWAAEACAEYEKRLRTSAKLEIVEMPASKHADSERQRSEESEKLLAAMRKRDADKYLLDEKGERMTSQEFSFLLSQARDSGRPLLFVLGGAYGVTSEVRKAVKGSVRLSDMTLPHELCRVVFLEQLYRGFEILKGSGYHH